MGGGLPEKRCWAEESTYKKTAFGFIGENDCSNDGKKVSSIKGSEVKRGIHSLKR
jgi:hypothetical protein